MNFIKNSLAFIGLCAIINSYCKYAEKVTPTCQKPNCPCNMPPPPHPA